MKRLETTTDWLAVGTDIRVNELKDYLDTLKTQLGIISNDYEKRIHEQVAKIEDENIKEEFWEMSGERYWDYTKTFPRILLNSFHVTSYSLFESEIFTSASRIGRKQNQLFDVSDFSGRDYLGIASFYISKITGVNIQQFRNWNLIDDGRKFRNIIVHSNGILSKQKNFDLAKKYGFIDESTIEDLPSVRSIVRLSLTDEYCQSFLLAMKGFFGELYSTADKYF